MRIAKRGFFTNIEMFFGGDFIQEEIFPKNCQPMIQKFVTWKKLETPGLIGKVENFFEQWQELLADIIELLSAMGMHIPFSVGQHFARVEIIID